jgi:hypothetical protein
LELGNVHLVGPGVQGQQDVQLVLALGGPEEQVQLLAGVGLLRGGAVVGELDAAVQVANGAVQGLLLVESLDEGAAVLVDLGA